MSSVFMITLHAEEVVVAPSDGSVVTWGVGYDKHGTGDVGRIQVEPLSSV